MIAFNTDVRLKHGVPKAVLGLIVGTFLIHVFFTSLQDFGILGYEGKWDIQAFNLSSPDPVQWLLSLLSHGDYWHWFGNMLYLWIFGSILEDRLGSAPFLGLFLVCGACADILHFFVIGSVTALLGMDVPPIRSLGASGAVSGIMGLAMFRFYHARVRIWLDWTGLLPIFRFGIPIWLFCAWFLLKQFFGIFFMVGSTNYLAHIGGFLGGVLAGPLLGFPKQNREEILWDKAVALKEGGFPALAAEEFLEQAPKRLDDPVVHREIGECLLRAGKFKRLSKDEVRKTALTHLTRAIDLHVHRGEKAEAVNLFGRMRDQMPPGEIPTGLQERMTILAQKGYGTPLREWSDPVTRRVQLEEELREKWNAGDQAGAYSLLVELGGMESLGQWPPIVLYLGAETAARMKDTGLAERLYEQVALKGDEAQTLRALLYLSRAWLKTPRQRRLSDLYRVSRERHVNIDQHPEWVELGVNLRS